MPQILLKLLELCQDEESGMAELAKLIANDAGITARVMQVANSAAYQRSGRKVSLLQALNTLGADLIKTLVISESVFKTFNGFPHTAGTDLRSFWKHALTAAVVARDLARSMNYAQVEEAYLAGLLHDVGRLALLAAAPDVYHVNFQSPDNETLCAHEQRALHISHAEAGAWLIERWGMDSFLADSVLYHHEASERLETAHPLIRLVHLAHLLSDQPRDTPLASGTGTICQLSDGQLTVICQSAEGQVMKAAEYLGIDLSGLDEMAFAEPVASPLPAASPVQQRLNEEIRNRALTAELGQVFARQKDDTQLLDSVRQNARVLFDLDDTAVFLMHGSSQTLVGVSVGEQRQRLADFSVSLAGGGGLAESVLQRSLVFLARDRGALNLAEDQLLRIFGSPCLVCLPLATNTRCLGMLLAGIEPWRVADLKRQERFLLGFGAQAAAALAASARERGEMDRRVAGVREEHLQNSRKVVHEANNPLSIIKNYLGVLDDKLARQQPVAGELSILSEEVDRVGNIIKAFAGAPEPAPDSVVDINRVINDIVRLFRESRFLPASVQIAARVPEHACDIIGSADTVKQILVNLIKNAVEALAKGGQIEVINQGASRRDGAEYYELQIRDSGPGLPDEVMTKLFSPVRSSKPGDNRGLGLSIVHGLVKKLSGKISCKSSPLGTSFEILLPARPARVLPR
ncbi:MAG: HDOD domain-containing protein [Comamonadaceae bacterium]|nr:HDOD domain-containing protein [Comamonadaceae bacterium]